MQSDEYEVRIRTMLKDLNISSDLIAAKALRMQAEAPALLLAEIDRDGYRHMLAPAAAQAWSAMKQAAADDAIVLEIVSAFRSLDDQVAIIRDKLSQAVPLAHILTLSAPPGYSEHHTGRAVDINTPGCEAREEPFEDTDAFRWLCVHAGRYGFVLSYPRANTAGFIYEPWHWLYCEAEF